MDLELIGVGEDIENPQVGVRTKRAKYEIDTVWESEEITDPNQLASVLVDFKPIKNSKTGELAARFDLVIGWTPED